MPAPSFLIMPARVMSLWLVTSASAGGFLRGETKNWEAFMGTKVTGLSSRNHGQACGKTRTRVLSTAGAIMSTVKESGSDYARPRGLQAQRRHCAAQLAQPGVLGKTSPHAFLAVPAR